MNLLELAEASALRTAMAAPAPLRRVLAGPAVMVDGQTLAPDIQMMLRLQSIARRRDESIPIETMRTNMRHETRLVGGEQRIGSVRDLEVAGRPARHYLPTTPAVAGAGPLLVYIHGGGFIEGDLETHDAACRRLAERSGVPVVATTYRRGPEAPFPAAHDDAYEGYRWVVDHAADLGADPERIAVGGDSAGGNLAASVALAAANDGVPVAWQLLVYPCTDIGGDTPSKRTFGQGYYLTQEFMDRANDLYFPDVPLRSDPRASVVNADVPAGLAPAYVVTAGFDPLRDEGEAYARKLADAGVKLELQRFTHLIHGFVNIVGVGSSARAAVDEIAATMRNALV